MSEPVSLEELLDQAAWLRRMAAGLLSDRDDAADVAQETLIAAWRQPGDRTRGVRGWLAQIARHRAVDHVRREGRRRARHQAAQAEAHDAPEPESLLGALEIHRAIAEIVDGLAPPFREALVLRYFEGLSSPEISRRLGVPAGTVRWRLKEGLERARAALDARHGGDRRAWRLMLVPLMPQKQPPSSWRVPAILMAGAGAVTVAVGAAAVYRRPPALHDGATMALPEPLMATTANSVPMPAVSSEVSSCAARLNQAHAEIVRMEGELFQWSWHEAYARGSDNPEATRALAPIMQAHLARVPWQVFGQRFSCRTWACRLAVLRPDGSFGLAGDEIWGDDFNRRARGTHMSSGDPDDRDAAEGLQPRGGQMLLVYLMRLRDPSGAPVGADVPLSVPPPRPTPAVPGDPEACEIAAAALEKLRTQTEARWAREEPKDHKFARSPPNPALTDEIDALIPAWRKPFGVTECRGHMCRRAFRVANAPRFLRLLWEYNLRDSLKSRYRAGSFGGNSDYYELLPIPP